MKSNCKARKQYADSARRQVSILILLSGFFISSCDLDKTEEEAEKAAAEMCDCIKKNSLDTCKDRLNKKYGHYSNNDEFITVFNNAQSCGVTIYKEK